MKVFSQIGGGRIFPYVWSPRLVPTKITICTLLLEVSFSLNCSFLTQQDAISCPQASERRSVLCTVLSNCMQRTPLFLQDFHQEQKASLSHICTNTHIVLKKARDWGISNLAGQAFGMRQFGMRQAHLVDNLSMSICFGHSYFEVPCIDQQYRGVRDLIWKKKSTWYHQIKKKNLCLLKSLLNLSDCTHAGTLNVTNMSYTFSCIPQERVHRIEIRKMYML